jgi:hypothetical protein
VHALSLIKNLYAGRKETWFLERVFDIFLWEIGGITNGGDTNE